MTALKPLRERHRQRGGRRLSRRIRLRFPADVKRDAQIPLLRPDFLEGHDAGEAGLIFEVLPGADDALEVLVGEEALGAFAGDFVHRVDEEDFPAPGLGLLRATYDDAGFHGRVVERVRAEAGGQLVEVEIETGGPMAGGVFAPVVIIWPNGVRVESIRSTEPHRV